MHFLLFLGKGTLALYSTTDYKVIACQTLAFRSAWCLEPLEVLFAGNACVVFEEGLFEG